MVKEGKKLSIMILCSVQGPQKGALTVVKVCNQFYCLLLQIHQTTWVVKCIHSTSTGKSFSEALILASNNPQYDDRLFIEVKVQYKKTTSSVHVVYTNWFLF